MGKYAIIFESSSTKSAKNYKMFELKAKSKNETDLILYGGISEWDEVRAKDFVKALATAKSQGYEKVNLRINSPGGSIFEGLAIISQMHSHGLIVDAIVDGIAASMASVLVASANKAYMVKGTRMMVHQGLGGVIGSAMQIKNYGELLSSLNKTIADILASKTKKDAQWILDNWMAEGKDTWLTAEEALEANLIDGILEGNVKPMPKTATANLLEMAAHYQTQLDQNENSMNKEHLQALGLKPDATDAEITAAIAAFKTATPPTPTSPTADANAKVVEGFMKIVAERGVTDEKQVAALKKVAETDITAAFDLLPKATAVPAGSISELIAQMKGQGSESKIDSSNWSYDEWEKHPKEFAALLEKEPKKYAKVFSAKFGYDPTEAELKAMI
ncbi:MAG: head maturation protease, ClpP-related [Shewanella sp.]